MNLGNLVAAIIGGFIGAILRPFADDFANFFKWRIFKKTKVSLFFDKSETFHSK